MTIRNAKAGNLAHRLFTVSSYFVKAELGQVTDKSMWHLVKLFVLACSIGYLFR